MDKNLIDFLQKNFYASFEIDLKQCSASQIQNNMLQNRVQQIQIKNDLDALIKASKHLGDEIARSLSAKFKSTYEEQYKVMFDRLGFKLEGVHKETHWTEGKWCDSLFYGYLRT